MRSPRLMISVLFLSLSGFVLSTAALLTTAGPAVTALGVSSPTSSFALPSIIFDRNGAIPSYLVQPGSVEARLKVLESQLVSAQNDADELRARLDQLERGDH